MSLAFNIYIFFVSALVQKRLRRERRTRRQLQEQLELETSRRTQLEDALRSAGASEQINIINEKLSQLEHKPNANQPVTTTSGLGNPCPGGPQQDRLSCDRPDRIKQEREDNPATAGYGQPAREVREPPPPPQETKPWGYSGIDLMNSGAAFWQNYSDSLAQELEMERKSRQQQVERDVKSPLQDRSSYYKNSVLFTSSAT